MLSESQIEQVKLAGEAIAEIASKIIETFKSFFASLKNNEKPKKKCQSWRVPKIIIMKSQTDMRKPKNIMARSRL